MFFNLKKCFQNLKHVHMTYSFHKLLPFSWFTLVEILCLSEIWFLTSSQKYTFFKGTNDEINIMRYTFSPVLELDVEKSFFCTEMKIP